MSLRNGTGNFLICPLSGRPFSLCLLRKAQQKLHEMDQDTSRKIPTKLGIGPVCLFVAQLSSVQTRSIAQRGSEKSIFRGVLNSFRNSSVGLGLFKLGLQICLSVHCTQFAHCQFFQRVSRAGCLQLQTSEPCWLKYVYS